MSNRGNKSLAEQQEAFKKGLLNQSKVISGISEARSANPVKNYAYGIKMMFFFFLMSTSLCFRSLASNSYRGENTH